MGKPNGSAAIYALRLRREMERRTNPLTGHPWSARGLGRAVDPADPERGRRQLLKHLRGDHLPSFAKRMAYADALGVPRDEFRVDEDDEEEALNRDLMRGIQAARRQLSEIERVVREEQETRA